VPAEQPTIVATSISFQSRGRGPYDWQAGPIYRGTHMSETVSEQVGKFAYLVRRGEDGQASETRIAPRRLS